VSASFGVGCSAVVPPEDCGADDVCGQAATFDDTAVASPKGRMGHDGTKGWDMNIIFPIMGYTLW
jgi:hypothetical protein